MTDSIRTKPRPRKPGAAARSLLGGDERLHVFGDPKEAAAYLARIPGSRIYAPPSRGWGHVLHHAITGAIRCKDLVVQIEHDKRSTTLALEIAVALYDRGAFEVRDANGHLIKAKR